MPVTLWPMRQTQQRLGDCLAILFGVPPLGGPAAGRPEGGTTTRRRVRAPGLQQRPFSACRPGALTRRSGCEISVLRLSILSLILNSLQVCAQDPGFGPAISVPRDLPEARLGSLPPRNPIDQTPDDAKPNSRDCLECHKGF